MIKVTTIFLALLVVIVLAGTSHAQLFIEDFDMYTGWSGGEETPVASTDGLATNGWFKAQISGLRRSVGAIRNKGIGGSQAGGQTFDIESYFGAAGRDVTGEVNPNGNYMVRSLINPGVSVDGVQGSVVFKIGDGTSTFDRYSNQNEFWVAFVFNQDTIHQVNGTVAHRDRIDLHATRNGRPMGDDFKSGDPGECALNPNWDSTNPYASNLEFLLLETGDAPCRLTGDVHEDVIAYFDYTKYGYWMETLVNINMNNEVGTLWLRDVDDTTGEATESWERFPWNFPLGTGSTVGIPFTTIEAAAWAGMIPLRNNTEAFLVDNFISGHPLLAGQGDFDGDGDIDGNDFLIWQNNFPTTDGAAISFIGDATGDGNVDGDDFLVWQNSFPYPASLSKTPEPASLGLLALGGLLMLRRRRT